MRCNKKQFNRKYCSWVIIHNHDKLQWTLLHQQIKALLKFYDPICKDEKLGGFFNQLRDDGTVYDSSRKHAVGKVIDTK